MVSLIFITLGSFSRVYNLSVSQNAWSDTIDNNGWIDRAYLYRVTENDAGENFQTLIPFYSEETNGEIVGSSGPFSITFTLEAKDDFALNIIGAGPFTRGYPDTQYSVHLTRTENIENSPASFSNPVFELVGGEEGQHFSVGDFISFNIDVSDRNIRDNASALFETNWYVDRNIHDGIIETEYLTTGELLELHESLEQTQIYAEVAFVDDAGFKETSDLFALDQIVFGDVGLSIVFENGENFSEGAANGFLFEFYDPAKSNETITIDFSYYKKSGTGVPVDEGSEGAVLWEDWVEITTDLKWIRGQQSVRDYNSNYFTKYTISAGVRGSLSMSLSRLNFLTSNLQIAGSC